MMNSVKCYTIACSGFSANCSFSALCSNKTKMPFVSSIHREALPLAGHVIKSASQKPMKTKALIWKAFVVLWFFFIPPIFPNSSNNNNCCWLAGTSMILLVSVYPKYRPIIQFGTLVELIRSGDIDICLCIRTHGPFHKNLWRQSQHLGPT